MNKYILAIVFGLLVSPVAHGAYFGFLDGKVYNENQVFQCMKLMDGNCYDLAGNLVIAADGEVVAKTPTFSAAPTLSGFETVPTISVVPDKQKIDFSQELKRIVMQPTYVQFIFNHSDYLRNGEYALTIDSRTVAVGRFVDEKKNPFVVFDGTFEAGVTYQLELIITGSGWEGNFATPFDFQ